MNENFPLPNNYKEWLSHVKDAYCVSYNGRCWFISTLDEMKQDVVIDKRCTPAWQQLKSLTEMFAELSGVEVTTDQEGKEIELKRLSGCVVIGDDNGDPLYFDPSDNNSVWCYYLGGGDVEKITNSLEQFMKKAEIINE